MSHDGYPTWSRAEFRVGKFDHYPKGIRAITQLSEEAFAEVKRFSEDELVDVRRRQESFTRSQDQSARPVATVREDIRAGLVESGDFDQP